jgi:hypothetical protein
MARGDYGVAKVPPGPPILTLQRPAGRPPLKRPYWHLRGGSPTGQASCGRLLPHRTHHAIRLWTSSNCHVTPREVTCRRDPPSVGRLRRPPAWHPLSSFLLNCFPLHLTICHFVISPSSPFCHLSRFQGRGMNGGPRRDRTPARTTTTPNSFFSFFFFLFPSLHFLTLTDSYLTLFFRSIM